MIDLGICILALVWYPSYVLAINICASVSLTKNPTVVTIAGSNLAGGSSHPSSDSASSQVTSTRGYL